MSLKFLSSYLAIHQKYSAELIKAFLKTHMFCTLLRDYYFIEQLSTKLSNEIVLIASIYSIKVAVIIFYLQLADNFEKVVNRKGLTLWGL